MEIKIFDLKLQMNLGQQIITKFDSIRFRAFDFCKLVNAELSLIQKNNLNDIRIKRREFKEIIEELVPISFYIQQKYSSDKKLYITWCGSSKEIDGSTTRYDGILERNLGATYSYSNDIKVFLEVTSALLKNHYLGEKLLVKDGGHFALKGIIEKDGNLISEVISYDGTEYVDELYESLSKILLKKLGKAYPRKTILIVRCDTDILYTHSDWKLLESKVRATIVNTKFVEIFIYDSCTERFFIIDQNLN